MPTARLHRLAFLLLCAFAIALVAGCGPSGPVNEKVTPENVKKIDLEMKLADVEALLGPGEPATPPPDADAEEKNLTWKRWKHSDRGSEVNVGFDKGNAAAALRKKTPK
jgi:hypothetical protein